MELVCTNSINVKNDQFVLNAWSWHTPALKVLNIPSHCGCVSSPWQSGLDTIVQTPLITWYLLANTTGLAAGLNAKAALSAMTIAAPIKILDFFIVYYFIRLAYSITGFQQSLLLRCRCSFVITKKFQLFRYSGDFR